MTQEERDKAKRQAESRQRVWEAYKKAGGQMEAEPDDSPPDSDRIGFTLSEKGGAAS